MLSAQRERQRGRKRHVLEIYMPSRCEGLLHESADLSRLSVVKDTKMHTEQTQCQLVAFLRGGFQLEQCHSVTDILLRSSVAPSNIRP